MDVLSETVLESGGVLTIEGEFKTFDSDVNLAAPVADCFCLFDGDAMFVIIAYLLPSTSDVGKIQPYFRFLESDPTNAEKNDASELGANYIIKGHSARLNLNYVIGDENISGYRGADTDSLTFGIQIQL